MKTFYLTFIAALLFSSCSDSKINTLLDSDDFDSAKDRVDELKKRIHSKSEFKNAEFELFSVNGFSNSRTSVPGGSSWDYKFVIKTSPDYLDKWTAGMVKLESSEIDMTWTIKITEKRKDEWPTSGRTECYANKEKNVIVILYRDDGLIFKRVIQN